MKIPLKTITVTYTKTLTFTPTSEMFELWDCPPDQEAFESMMLHDFFDEIYNEMRASGDPMPNTDVQQFETHEIEWEEALDWEIEE